MVGILTRALWAEEILCAFLVHFLYGKLCLNILSELPGRQAVALVINLNAGFRTMGVRRKSKMMGGKLWDTIYMEAPADEFESPVLGQILIADQPR
jgi:hypothetical protein